jgi:hypothetical protein
MLFREMIGIYFENHMKHLNSLGGQNVWSYISTRPYIFN